MSKECRKLGDIQCDLMIISRTALIMLNCGYADDDVSTLVCNFRMVADKVAELSDDLEKLIWDSKHGNV